GYGAETRVRLTAVQRACRRGDENGPRHHGACAREEDPDRAADRRGARPGGDDRAGRAGKTGASRTRVAQAVTVVLVAGVSWAAPPEGLSVEAWRLFALFAGAIFSVVVSALPILTASVLAVAGAVLTGLLRPADAYSGFGNGTILLIVIAFLVASAVVKCGLGARAGHLIVSLLGRSTLGLAYSILLLDAIIAPAFPSNTARSGVLYPLTFSLAEA